MLVYLDNGENIKSHPNENFGRELLELFSMGVGNYTERDVREAARAFTGWTNDVLAYKFDAAQHDFGEKTFLGRKGTFNGDDIIRIILEQPVTGEFVAAKLYRYFVREEIVTAVKTELGRAFRQSGYQIEAAADAHLPLEGLLQPAVVRDADQEPGAPRRLDLQARWACARCRPIPDFGRMTGGLGQSLFDPPNVAGWAGGRTWITPATLLQRGNMFRDVLFPDVKGFRPPDRAMSATDQRVGERLAQGHEHHRGDARRRRRVEQDGRSRRGLQHALRRIRRLSAGVQADEADPAAAESIDLSAMVQAAGADTADKVVDHFVHRFMRVSLADKDRAGPRGVLAASSGRRWRQARTEELAARVAVSGAQHAGVSARVNGYAESQVRLRGRYVVLLFAPRLPRSRDLRHRCRRRAAAGPRAAPRPRSRRRRSQGTSVEKHPNRILVVIELSGGNDGLNTVVPFGDAAYYRAQAEAGDHRTRGHQGRRRLRLPSVDGRLRATLQGRPCWPSSTAAATTIRACRTSRRWGSGTPACRTAASRSDGWVVWPTRPTTAATRNMIVNLGNSQSLAVRSRSTRRSSSTIRRASVVRAPTTRSSALAS